MCFFVGHAIWNSIALCINKWALWTLWMYSLHLTFFELHNCCCCCNPLGRFIILYIYTYIYVYNIDTISSTLNVRPLLSMRNKHKNAIGYYVHTNFIRTSVAVDLQLCELTMSTIYVQCSPSEKFATATNLLNIGLYACIHLQCMKCVSKNPCIRHSFPFRVVIVKMDTLTVEILLRIPFIQFTRHFLPAQFSDTWKFRGKNTCHVLWRINNSEPGSFSQWESNRFRTKYVLRFVNL